jgi:hypothetical protein
MRIRRPAAVLLGVLLAGGVAFAQEDERGTIHLTEGYVPWERREKENEERQSRVEMAENREQQAAAGKADPTKGDNAVKVDDGQRTSRLAEVRAHRDRRDEVDTGTAHSRLPKGAVKLDVRGGDYAFADDTFYRKSGSGWVTVAPPLGAVVPKRPGRTRTVRAGSKRYFYQAGYYYERRSNHEYVVVKPPAGTIVPYLPEGAEVAIVDDLRFYDYAGVRYRRVFLGGRVVYKVVATA